MRRSFLLSFAATVTAIAMAQPVQSATVFSFTNNSELDDQPAGTTMIRDGVTLTSLSFSYPDLSSAPTIGGILTTGGETNILLSGSLGVDNPTITAGDFATSFGPGSEQSNFNFDETWVFEFDQPVTVDEIDFASLTGTDGDTFTFDIGGNVFVVNDGNTTSDVSTDPFSGLVIGAGQDISVTFSSALGDTSAVSRIAAITITVVPEPALPMFLASAVPAWWLGRRRVRHSPGGR